MKRIFILTLYFLIQGVQINAQTARSLEDKEDKEKATKKSVIDHTHSTVSDTILLFTNRIDSFFGTPRGDEEANGSKLRVFVDHGFREYKADNTRVDLRFTLKLPQLEKLFKFEFNKDPKKVKAIKEAAHEDSLEQIENQTQQEEQSKGIFSIPYKLLQKWTYGISAGVRVTIPPDPYLRARLRRTFLFGGFEFNPTQEVSWFLKEGVGYSMTNDLDYQVGEWGLLRLVNSLNWRDNEDEIFTSHGPNFFLPLSDKTAIQFYAIASGRNRPTFYIHQYSAGASYRRSIYSNWAFFSINPNISWPETSQWKRILSLDLRLEAVFGSL